MRTADTIAILEQKIAIQQRQIEVLRVLGEKLKDLDVEAYPYDNYIDFHSLSHADAVLLFQRIPGKWKKELNYHDQSTIDYINTEFDKDITIRLWSAGPPPSCRIVEEKVEVPARTEIRRKLVCTETQNQPQEITA